MKPPKPANEEKRLEALRQYEVLDTPPEAMFDDIVSIAATIAETPIALISLLDQDRQWFKACLGLDVCETPREHAFCAYTILTSEPMVVEDATQDLRFAENPLVTSDPYIRFYAGAPLMDDQGVALGTLCVIDREPRTFGRERQQALEALARSVVKHFELRKVTARLAVVLEELETARGMLPICANCKNIRDDQGYWRKLEEYFRAHANTEFSHGICPGCMQALYPEIYAEMGGAPNEPTVNPCRN